MYYQMDLCQDKSTKKVNSCRSTYLKKTHKILGEQSATITNSTLNAAIKRARVIDRFHVTPSLSKVQN